MPLNINVVPLGMIKTPRIVRLPDGPDHINWIEVGKQEPRGLECFIIGYAPYFGHLWRSGWISEEELQKARSGKKYSWISSGLGGHGS